MKKSESIMADIKDKISEDLIMSNYRIIHKANFYFIKVVVEVNGIVSSCKSDSCSFEFQESSTGKITSVSPTSGYGTAKSAPCQQKVMIGCTGCGTSASDVDVFFGPVKAVVESLASDVITVCPGTNL